MQVFTHFQNADMELVLAISDFSYDKFAVDEDGQVIYTDMSDLLIIERSQLDENGKRRDRLPYLSSQE